jgi:hypothetical protein
LDWETNLEEFSYVGSVEASREDHELMSTCQSFGPLSTASKDAEGEWRWKNDRLTYEDEVERARQAREQRRVTERALYEKRLKGLTWEKLLQEWPLESV